MTSQSLKVKHVKVLGYSLLNIRLWCYSLAFVHLVVTAIVTLNIDVTGDEDPMVRAYSRVRWKLLTCLFNLVSLGYLPLCLYCDWCEKRGDKPPHVEQLRILRDVVMTSILMPITTFADVMFWILFKTCPSLIAPPRVFEYLPFWAQHSLHTVSIVTLIMDLLLTPRRRPSSMKPGLAVLSAVALGYGVMLYVTHLNGEQVYGFMMAASNSLMLVLYLSFHILLTVCYYAQWPIIDYVWGQRIQNTRSKKSVKLK